MNPDAVFERAETAVERFCDDIGWEIGLGRGEQPSYLRTVRDLLKRGPAHLVARLGLQHVRDRL